MRHRQLAALFVAALAAAWPAAAADAWLTEFRFRPEAAEVDLHRSPDFEAEIARARLVAVMVSARPDVSLVLEQDASLTGREAAFTDARTAEIAAALGLPGATLVERFAAVGDPDAARLRIEAAEAPPATCPWFVDVHLPATVGGGTVRLPARPGSLLRLPAGATATFETTADPSVHAARFWQPAAGGAAQVLAQPLGRSATVILRLSAHEEPTTRDTDTLIASRGVADHASATVLSDRVDCIFEIGR